MVEYAPSNEPEASKRRSTRIVQSIPLMVSGVDALGQPFRERTSTLIVNCHGFKYLSNHYVLKGTALEIEVPNTEAGQPARKARGHVTFVQRPRTVKELFQVGVEMETAGNVWGIAFPPEDWFTYGQQPAAETSKPPVVATAPPSAPVAVPPQASRMPSPTQFPAARPAEKPAETAPFTAPIAAGPEFSASVNRQVTRMLADAREEMQRLAKEASAAAMAREAASMLRELNAQLKTAAEKAVQQAASGYAEKAMHMALQKFEEARESSKQELRAMWAREFEKDLRDSSQQLQGKLAEMGEDFRKDLSLQISTDITASAGRLAEIESRLQELHEQAAADADKIPSLLENARKEMDALAEETKKQWSKRLASYAESGLSRLSELDAAALKLQEKIQVASDTAQTGWRQKLEQDVAAATAQLEKVMETSFASAERQLAERMAEASKGVAFKVSEEIEKRAGEIHAQVAAATSDSERRVAAAQAVLDEKLLLGKECATEIAVAEGRVKEQTQHLEELARNAGAEVVREFEALLATNRELLNGQAEIVLANDVTERVVGNAMSSVPPYV